MEMAAWNRTEKGGRAARLQLMVCAFHMILIIQTMRFIRIHDRSEGVAYVAMLVTCR
jgi:hypothetical protein